MPSLAHEALATLMHLTVHRRMPHDDEGMLAELTAAQLRPRSFAPPRSLDRHVSLRVGVRHGWRTYEMAPWGPRLPAHRVVYFHGGGYVGEIDPNHWSVCRRIATLTPARVVVPIYPVAPGTTAEVTVPTAAAIAADVIADAILGGGDAPLVSLLGGSESGGLGLGGGQVVEEGQIAAPRLVLIAPWVDATMTHSDIDVVGARDPMLSIPRLTRAGELYAGHLAVSDPRVSPINGSMTGLGPMTIFAGTRDLLLPDARRLRGRGPGGGLGRGDYAGGGLSHVFPILPLPEARQARRAIVGAIRWPG